MDEIDRIFALVAAGSAGHAPTIACLYTGADRPSMCVPMLRTPEPEIGQPLDDTFADYLATVLALNPAVHDGAVMLRRRSNADPYSVSGWSYRLFPAETLALQIPNRGSAFNSCLAMSTVTGVDRLYLVKSGSGCRFEGGLITQFLDKIK